MLACKSDQRTCVRVVAALVGTLLLFSPFYLDFAGMNAAAWSAWVLGFALFSVSMATAVEPGRAPDLLTVALGAACLAAPALVDFPEVAPALWAHGLCGAAAAVLGAVSAFVLVDTRQNAGAATGSAV